ncbi:MAG: hypothetical protein FD167_4566, partial [bacterium]
MSGMKFRRSCNSCNTTFFAEDRRAFLCPKCAKKKAAAPPPPVTKPVFNKPTQSSYSAKPVNNTTPSRPSFANPAQRKFVKPSKPIRPRVARQPKIGVLTDELRDKIIDAYSANKDSINSAKMLHAKISHELWVKPKLVADTINQLRKQEKATIERCTLPDEDREKVLAIYLKLIREDIRPLEGRRNYIANV